jgi:glutamyl-tRNA reductase
MARAAVQQLSTGLDLRDVEVYARRPGIVEGRATLSWERAIDALRSFPVVISTVPGVVPLFDDIEVSRGLEARTEPLLLIDLGMPPGFPSIASGPSLVYMGVDEVAASVSPRPAVEAEEKIVRGATAVWRRLAAPDRVGAVISAMMQQADEAVSEEVVRFANRLQAASDPDRVLRQLAHSVARRVLHGPISYVGSSDRGADAIELMAEAFGITTSRDQVDPAVERHQ